MFGVAVLSTNLDMSLCLVVNVCCVPIISIDFAIVESLGLASAVFPVIIISVRRNATVSNTLVITTPFWGTVLACHTVSVRAGHFVIVQGPIKRPVTHSLIFVTRVTLSVTPVL